ncbi:MAG: HpaII family restriction endonuclease, partial [Candidatus Cloacimonadales bacterium]|nr:HpaII family restriction endonuclease [Candidatus Cloacimonadales bacterium]
KMRYNKGEWSEAYVFLKILGDGKVTAGNSNEGDFYPILTVFKENECIVYKIIHNDQKSYETDHVCIERVDKKGIKKISSKELISKYSILLNKIEEGKGRSFSIPEINKFLNKIGINRIKEGSQSKSDISLEIRDLKAIKDRLLSWSIKSFLGGKPTILNASDSTTFIYKINNIKEEDLAKINSFNKLKSRDWLKERINYIKSEHQISFVKINSSVFENNLKFIDTSLDRIISDMLLEFYSTKKLVAISDLIDKISENNILAIETNAKELYKAKLLSFIKASAFGMMPNVEWTGQYDIDGGLILALSDGLLKMYHLLYEKEEIDNIFYENTKFETPSSTRYKMGEIYKENGDFFFNLNLQIRFK